MQLSEHFSLEELSTTQSRQWIDQNYEEALQHKDMLTKLCVELLEPIRLALGPIHVDSGYRCKGLNLAIGGSTTSQHCLGMAADLKLVDDMSYDGCVKIYNWLKSSGLSVHQVLLEGGCTHVSLPTGTNDCQFSFAIPDPLNKNHWLKTNA